MMIVIGVKQWIVLVLRDRARYEQERRTRCTNQSVTKKERKKVLTRLITMAPKNADQNPAT